MVPLWITVFQEREWKFFPKCHSKVKYAIGWDHGNNPLPLPNFGSKRVTVSSSPIKDYKSRLQDVSSKSRCI